MSRRNPSPIRGHEVLREIIFFSSNIQLPNLGTVEFPTLTYEYRRRRSSETFHPYRRRGDTNVYVYTYGVLVRASRVYRRTVRRMRRKPARAATTEAREGRTRQKARARGIMFFAVLFFSGFSFCAQANNAPRVHFTAREATFFPYTHSPPNG